MRLLPAVKVQPLAHVLCRNARHFQRIHITHRCQCIQAKRQVLGTVALTAVLRNGHVRGIGFQQDRLQRQRGCQRTQLAGAFKRQHAAKAETETEIDILLRLLQAAVEGMHDTATDTQSFQRGQHLVVRLQHMQDDRQLCVARNQQLRLEQCLLAISVEVIDVKIQTDLANGNGAVMRDPLFQLFDIARRVVCQEHRVQSERRVQPRHLLTQRPQRWPPGCLHRRHHETGHARRAAALDDRVTIVIEGWQVQVTMAVDQLHTLILCRAGVKHSRFLVCCRPMTVDISRRFGGVARLYGDDGLCRLQQSHVCVLGIGGVGSWAAEALARTAVGGITLVDLDHVAESNINRQLHALDDTLGMAKVDVMAARIRAINPDCKVQTIEAFITPDNMAELLDKGFDYIIDCIDGFRTKARLIAHCKRNKLKLITVGGAGGQRDPTRIRVADLSRTEHDALFSKTRKLLRHDYGFPANPKRRFDIPCVYSEEQPLFPAAGGGVSAARPDSATVGGLSCAGGLGSAMPVTASFGLAAAAYVLKKLAAPPGQAPLNQSSPETK